MFRVGQKVVCVDATDADVTGSLVEGAIYTIASIRAFTKHEATTAGIGVRLVEIEQRETDDYWGYYLSTRFRPIVSRPTSIEFAHEILRKATRTDEVSA